MFALVSQPQKGADRISKQSQPTTASGNLCKSRKPKDISETAVFTLREHYFMVKCTLVKRY